MSQEPERLSAFLRRTRASALDVLRQLGSASGVEHKDVPHLTLTMGNEAGDLDSLASSIAMSYMLTHLHDPLDAGADSSTGTNSNGAASKSTIYAPLIQTAAADLYLRPENEAICQFAGVPPAGRDAGAGKEDPILLTIDALEGGPGSVADALGMGLSSDPRLDAAAKHVSFGLVDHPALIPRWGEHEKRDVRFIVDHHKDEGAHPHAKVRFLRGPGSVPSGKAPVGSASSLVVEVFQDQLIKAAAQPAGKVIPRAVADLLISAIVIDTDNLRPVSRGGRATPRDVLSHAILLPLSSFGPSSSGTSSAREAATEESSISSSGDGPDGGRSTDRASSGQGASQPAVQSTATSGTNGAQTVDSVHGNVHGASEGVQMHVDTDEPTVFTMCEDVDMTDEFSTCQASSQANTVHSDFKTRCGSEASTAGPCPGARPFIPNEEASRANAVEEETDDQDDVMEEMAGQDLYKILGLKRGTPQSSIRTAYRREALKCHPDRARSLRDAERRTRRFKLLVNAYEILSDPIKRRQYDLFHDPLTTGVRSGDSTPGASFDSSSFSYSYSSSYTSASFFGSSFSSTFSSSPPPHGGFASAAGGMGGNWKYETYEELKAEELARTETRTVADSLFGKADTRSSARMGSVPVCRKKDRSPPASLRLSAPSTGACTYTPTTVLPTSSQPLPVATTTTPAAVVPTAPVPQKFSFVWESPAESLRRARARPGQAGTTSSASGAASSAARVDGAGAAPGAGLRSALGQA